MKIVTKPNYRVQERPVASDKCVIVFTAMGTRIGLYEIFIQRMNRKGYSCIMYDYPLRMVLDSRPAEWEEIYTELVQDAKNRIRIYKQKGHKNFYAYGISMGTLWSAKLARETPEISHVVINLTYGDLATNLWTYRGVKKIKATLEREGQTLESTRGIVAFADPIVNAPKLKGKKVLLYLSRTDRVQVYDQTKHTLAAFKEAELDLQYIENKYLGHFIGGTKNMLGIKQLIKFLES